MDINLELKTAVDKVNAMSADEFAKLCEHAGYTPIKKELIHSPREENDDFVE